MLAQIVAPAMLASLIVVAQAVAPDGLNWQQMLAQYGPLGLFCLYMVLRGEKKLDENTKAVKALADAIAAKATADLHKIIADDRIHPDLKEAAKDALATIATKP